MLLCWACVISLYPDLRLRESCQQSPFRVQLLGPFTSQPDRLRRLSDPFAYYLLVLAMGLVITPPFPCPETMYALRPCHT